MAHETDHNIAITGDHPLLAKEEESEQVFALSCAFQAAYQFIPMRQLMRLSHHLSVVPLAKQLLFLQVAL